MKSSIHMFLILLLILFACAPAVEKKDTFQIALKPMPEPVSETLEEAGAYLETVPDQAPDVYEPGEWPLIKTGERVLALLDKGAREGVLSAREKELLISMADYMLTFQFEKEEDFCLPGAALALAGLVLSTPEKPDHRYGYGLSRMWYGYTEWKRPERLRDLVSYVLDAAASRGLPLLPGMLKFYADTGMKAPANVKTFDPGGTELEFLHRLELPGDWGLKLSAALKAGDQGLAKSLVAHYYADKISCFRPLIPAGEVDLDEAEDLLKNIIILRAHMERRHDFGETVDWTTVLDGDIESNVSLNHHPMMLHLAKAWAQTGDDRFRDHLIELMRSWLEQSPRPNICQWLQWRTLEVGGRAANRWPQVLALLSGDSTFVAEMFFPMVYSLYQHADYLMVNNMRHPNNWSQVESAGLLAASLLLSEHRDSGLYRKTALRRFRYLNSFLYFPDGLQTENSFYYHGFPLGTQMNVYEIAQSLGTVLDTS
ncbi:MAG: heparinase II/III family protein, partial [Gemmatimonadota bacterium]|nr:heparinase II/III family protein [Gemmatimonadota bacterium]